MKKFLLLAAIACIGCQSANLIGSQTPETKSVESTMVEQRRLNKAFLSKYAYFLGPWGGTGGSMFYFEEIDGMKLVGLGVLFDTRITGIAGYYKDSRGGTYVRNSNPQGGGFYKHIPLADNEYITAIGGTAGRYVNSLSITTNQRCYPEFGKPSGQRFFASVRSGYRIYSFFGRSGKYLDKIGCNVYTR
jgi:hypothetical protein